MLHIFSKDLAHDFDPLHCPVDVNDRLLRPCVHCCCPFQPFLSHVAHFTVNSVDLNPKLGNAGNNVSKRDTFHTSMDCSN